MSEVGNCHYISRCVTKAWERKKDRHLHYFDIPTGTLECEPSRTLFAARQLNTTETERRLSRGIEDSIGKYLAKCQQTRTVYDFNQDQRMSRALVALIALQGPRTHEALAPDEKRDYRVDDILQREGTLDHLVDLFLRDSVLVAGTIPSDEWMAFPSLGWFPIPVIGFQPAMAIPLTPGMFVALVPREADMRHFESMIRTPNHISVFSQLGGKLERKLVVPSSVAERVPHADLIAWVKFARVNGRKVFNLIGKMAHVAGLPAYVYDEPG